MRALGVAAALTSAASWALTAVLWRRLGDEISPYAMNLAKGLIGGAYLALALVLVGAGRVDARACLALALSGVFGIALGDTWYFKCLVSLGPRLATLIGALGPVATAVLAALLLGERPSPVAWLGVAAASAGAAWVVLDGLPRAGAPA
ncbi:MAG: DMT family transporter, partial [Elusimicrobia bacterium]|nr:DMT family transporter [Elusimicrobiota bacterium]